MKLILNLLMLPINIVAFVFFGLYAVCVLMPGWLVIKIADNLFGELPRQGSFNYNITWFKW